MNKILIASTNLHLIDSIILNNQFNTNFHLVYIGKENILFNHIKYNFSSFLYLEENKSSKKIELRITNAKKLIDFIKNLNPNEIIVGNDRKIETSILIKNYNTIYSYMDDGLHSYILEKQHIFKYTFFEKYLKKIIYKNDLVLPKYIGCAKYIKNVYLFKPQFANKCLKNKNLIPLDISLLNINLDLSIPTFKKLILLPHPKFINSQILEKIKPFIDENTAIKSHPRDNNNYFDIITINKEIPLEALLLKIDKNTKIYGYKTTAILIAKWLGFDVYNFGKNTFMQKNGIKAIDC